MGQVCNSNLHHSDISLHFINHVISHESYPNLITRTIEITFGSSGLKLNWYGMMYGSLAIFLGIFWYIGMVLCDLMYKVMPPWGNKTKERWFDPNRRLPITISHLWGMTVMAITGCLPIIKGRENLKMLYDKER